MGLLSATGQSRVLVRPAPRVVILSTGDEIVRPGELADETRIVSSNAYALAAVVRAETGGIRRG